MSRFALDGTDEDQVIMHRNPKGGRPMNLGQPSFTPNVSDIDISMVKEESEIRYHLGYCACSRAIKVGSKKAELLVTALMKQGIQPLESDLKTKEKLAQYVLEYLGVDNFRKNSLTPL